MAYCLKDLNNLSQFSFDNEVKTILEYLTPMWDIKAEPKGYAEYKKTYKDYDGMEELDEKALLESFKGHDGSGTISYPFAVQVTLPQVTYEDTNQGRPPLNVLIGAILGYGMTLGMRISAIDSFSDANKRLSAACHAYTILNYPLREENINLSLIRMAEANDYRTKLDKPVEEIRKEYHAKRLDFIAKRIDSLKELFKDRTSITFKFGDKNNEVHYEVLNELDYLFMNNEKVKEFLSKQGFNYKHVNYDYTLSLKKKRIKKNSMQS